MYDCRKDPHQLLNVASVPDYREELSELNQVLKAWMQETGNNIPENLTKDWYRRVPGYIKTENINIRGEPVDRKFNAARNNSKGKF